MEELRDRVICLARTRGSSIPSDIHTNKPKKSRVTQDELVTLELNVLEVSFLSLSHPGLLPVKQEPFKMQLPGLHLNFWANSLAV